MESEQKKNIPPTQEDPQQKDNQSAEDKKVIRF